MNFDHQMTLALLWIYAALWLSGWVLRRGRLSGNLCCAPDIPAPQDPSIGYIEGMTAELANFPFDRAIQTASRLGQKVTVDGVEYDFTGIGEADYQRKYARQMAKAMLEVQRKHGPEYIKQRLAELEQSDPQGAQARRDLFGRIMADLGTPTDTTLNRGIESQIMADLERGKTLDPQTEREIQQMVRGAQVARGGGYGAADITQEAEALEQAGSAQDTASRARAAAFLQSGMTPEDVEYRELHQNLSNLGAFINGQSPQAQFGALAGAQNQAAPFYQMNPLPGMNPNAGVQGVQLQQQNYNAQSNFASQQANPWLTSVGLGIQAAGAYNSWQTPKTVTNPMHVRTF